MNMDAQNIVFANNCDRNALHVQENTTMREMTDDEKIDFVAARVLEKYKPAFLELAK